MQKPKIIFESNLLSNTFRELKKLKYGVQMTKIIEYFNYIRGSFEKSKNISYFKLNEKLKHERFEVLKYLKYLKSINHQSSITIYTKNEMEKALIVFEKHKKNKKKE